MQRHRAGRLAVLLSLNKIDSKPDGVARTTCVQPGAPENGRSPSTVGLMAPSGSENSIMGGSENEASSRNLVSSGESQPMSDATKPIQEEDSGLEMNIDTTQATNVLRLDGINKENRSASDDSGIQIRETAGLGSKSPTHDGGTLCAGPPCGVEPNGAGCDQSCAAAFGGEDGASRTPSSAQLLRRPSIASNDYLGKSSTAFVWVQVCLAYWGDCGVMLICNARLRFELECKLGGRGSFAQIQMHMHNAMTLYN